MARGFKRGTSYFTLGKNNDKVAYLNDPNGIAAMQAPLGK